MDPKIGAEHEWLRRLVGRWTIDAVAAMPEGQQQVTGRETVRMIGDAWIVCEGETTTGDGPPSTHVITLGYDGEKQQFVGTFIGSTMTHLWVYHGGLDEASRTLILDTEGPDFARPGTMSRYQDRLEIASRDRRVLSSHMPSPDGGWTEFMSMTYTRVE